MKKIESITQPPAPHWVGNGFPVRSLFSYHQHAHKLSPFLLLDYAGPRAFPGDKTARGVGEHPHRGFETVTLVYQGEVEHRDSTGKGGKIGKGDVQWMTAGAGILHEELHSRAFREQGGNLQMVQLWVNLPASSKLVAPSYQGIQDTDIPRILLTNSAGELRVIAGEFEGKIGPARTHTPMQVLDAHLHANATITFHLTENWNSMIVVLEGSVSINDSSELSSAQVAHLNASDTGVTINASESSLILILSGEPINEPIVGHGPFVMNSKEEVMQAIDDFNSGKFGKL
ncbi:pirin family protein [Alteromonas ponticola]|uniref:Pirin family protein n=1 Tax=Alteromonas ponticola TaxID=2720613 RepID=A0ABX1R5R7_9ALTE|nr:pirin family protein [Alteromonas ponticola]NMH60991.1 pirin family protein [Alteromonas ponticola]